MNLFSFEFKTENIQIIYVSWTEVCTAEEKLTVTVEQDFRAQGGATPNRLIGQDLPQ